MLDQQKASTTGQMKVEEHPTDDAVAGLSRRIAAIHERLGDWHRARAEFERQGGRPGPDAAHPVDEPWSRPGNPLSPLGPPLQAGGFEAGLCHAYRDRGRARLAREEYHLALADFGAALVFHPAAADRDLTGDLWDGRTEAWDNLCGSFPERGDEGDKPPPEAAAPPWMARSITSGHLVVGDNVILGLYPPTPEGHRAAVEQAERLAGDAGARSTLVHRYLVDSDDFDVLVYAFDGARLRLDYQAQHLDDYGPDPRIASGTDDAA